MIREGQIILVPFPHTDLNPGKLRPALLIKKLPNEYNDWLICAISSKLDKHASDLDIPIVDTDENFTQTGLKRSSAIRLTRLAVVEQDILLGTLGSIDEAMLDTVKTRLSDWLTAGEDLN